jgi:hypothetical protein
MIVGSIYGASFSFDEGTRNVGYAWIDLFQTKGCGLSWPNSRPAGVNLFGI